MEESPFSISQKQDLENTSLHSSQASSSYGNSQTFVSKKKKKKKKTNKCHFRLLIAF